MLSRWMSILVTVIILVTGALGYYAVEQITRREIKLEFDQRVSETQQRLQAAFQAYVSERISILTILTDLYKRGQVPDAAAHAQYADLIMSAIPGFVAVNFVDPQFVVRRVYPFESNQDAYLLDYKKYPSRLDPLRESAKWGEIKVADPEPLIQGGVGFMNASPVVDRAAKGLIVGVVDVGAMVANLVRPALDKDSGFILRTGEGAPFFTEEEAREDPGTLETVKAPLKVGDNVWTIQFGLAAGSVGKAMTLYRTSAAVTGALLVSTLIALLWILRERGASFEQMVVERTDALKGSEEKYRALFLQANEGIVLIDPLNFRVIDANESFENLAGYRAPALQTMSWTDLLVEDERERGRLMLERTVTLGAVDRIDLTLRRREGDPVYASFSPALVEVQGGKFIQGTVRDVTDIRRATSEVRRLSAAINATGEHFYIIDLNGTVI
ncbi:MAG: PAS domain S-box protein, partial [Candidatus Methylomirabilis sp.]|nr:PAS domain S-box protein [Deltaproteobacteria bacterium]